MAYGTYNIPKPLKDEDKWYGLTKTQWVWVGGLLGTSLLMYKILHFFIEARNICIGITIIYTLIASIFIVFAAFVTRSNTKYLSGGGLKGSEIIKRIVIRKLPFNRIIYTKNINEQ